MGILYCEFYLLHGTKLFRCSYIRSSSPFPYRMEKTCDTNGRINYRYFTCYRTLLYLLLYRPSRQATISFLYIHVYSRLLPGTLLQSVPTLSDVSCISIFHSLRILQFSATIRTLRLPPWKKKTYKTLSLGFTGTEKQRKYSQMPELLWPQ